MQTHFVIAKCDVYCEWSKTSPIYRCYVNDELFAERTWIWKNSYLEESLQIQAPVGRYQVRFELVTSKDSILTTKNLRVFSGPAVVAPDGTIQIYTPEGSK